jgi:hypothetical protein
MPESGARAIVSDDGSTIWLTAYTEAGDAVPVALAPVRAVALAGELIEAAVPKLGKITEANSMTGRPKRRRGGDHQAEKRQQRNEDILALAALMGESNPTDLAEYMAQQLGRLRPMPEEPNPKRGLMQKINGYGLPVGKRQIRKILAQQKTRLEGHGSPRD